MKCGKGRQINFDGSLYKLMLFEVMKVNFLTMNIKDMENILIHMVTNIKVNGKILCLMVKDTKSLIVYNIKEHLKKELNMDMEKFIIRMETNIWESFQKINMKVLGFFYI